MSLYSGGYLTLPTMVDEIRTMFMVDIITQKSFLSLSYNTDLNSFGAEEKQGFGHRSFCLASISL